MILIQFSKKINYALFLLPLLNCFSGMILWFFYDYFQFKVSEAYSSLLNIWQKKSLNDWVHSGF